MRKDFIKINSLGSILMMLYYTSYMSKGESDKDTFFWILNRDAEETLANYSASARDTLEYLTEPVLNKNIRLYEEKYFSERQQGLYIRADVMFPVVAFFMSDMRRRGIRFEAENFMSCNYDFLLFMERYIKESYSDESFDRIISDFRRGMKKTFSSFAWWEKGGIHRKHLKEIKEGGGK